MEYTDQSSGAIRLYLTKGQIDLAQFTVLLEKTCSWNDLKVSFGVLGASHYVQLTTKEKVFTEICACSDATLPEDLHIFENDFLANLPTEGVRTLFDDFTYEFSFEFKNWEEGSAQLSKLRALQEKNGVHFLSHIFPKSETDTDDPITEVYIAITEGGLTMHSVHTYPNEEIMVFTTSSLHM